MADVLAIISKSQFEPAYPRAVEGVVLPVDRYLSKNKALASLSDGGSLFLVTVRPPNEALWLVAILEQPKFDGEKWTAAPNTQPERDITGQRDQLVFSTGKGIQAKPGALGMSLQTPRQLTTSDTALLRGSPLSPVPTMSAEAPRRRAKPTKEQTKGPTANLPTEKRPSNKATADKGKRSEPRKMVDAKWLDPALKTGSGPEKLELHVVEHPEDIDARRVLSDALLERGDPRGEYIRLSLQLDELGSWDRNYSATLRAVRALEARYGRTWVAPCLAVPYLRQAEGTWGGSPLAFGRGAVEKVSGQAKDVVPALAAAAKVMPLSVLSLRVDSANEAKHLAELARLPELSRVQRLTLQYPSDDESYRAVLACLRSDHLGTLEELQLAGGMDETLASVLAELPAFANLKVLRLSNHTAGIGASGLEVLMNGSVLAGLRQLDLGMPQLGSAGFARLGQLETLESLKVSQASPTDKAISEFARANGLSRLRHLCLDSVRLTNKGASALVSGVLPNLEVLELRAAGINGKVFGAMLNAWNLPALWNLELSGNNLRAAGAELLAGTDVLHSLKVLGLAGNGLKHDGARALAAATNLPVLERLDLNGNALEGAALSALAEGSVLRTVREIELRNNKCQNAGGEAFARWPELPRARRLSLYYNWMGVKGVRGILERMEDAENLFLGENNYGVEPTRALARSSTIRRLHTLALREADERWLKEFAQSEAAGALEDLNLSQCHVTQACAEALVALPCLGRIRLDFCTIEPEVSAYLQRHFGPFLNWWPPLR